jgi:hypothetical protein
MTPQGIHPKMSEAVLIAFERMSSDGTSHAVEAKERGRMTIEILYIWINHHLCLFISLHQYISHYGPTSILYLNSLPRQEQLGTFTVDFAASTEKGNLFVYVRANSANWACCRI